MTEENFKAYLPLLKELQKIDKRVRQVDAQLQTIPEELENSGAEYLKLARAVESKEEAQSAQNKERLSLERDLQAATEEVTKREARIYAIKTQKEYQATVTEIAKMKQENRGREDRILALLESSEKLTEEITQLKQSAADKEGSYRAIEKELNERKIALEKEREQMVERRPVLLKELSPALLGRYDSVRGRHADALAAVVKGVCCGCHMNIPPQIYNEMLKGLDLRNCPNCSRLIYAELGEVGKDKKEKEKT